jgi:hypothetical protein
MMRRDEKGRRTLRRAAAERSRQRRLAKGVDRCVCRDSSGTGRAKPNCWICGGSGAVKWAEL